MYLALCLLTIIPHSQIDFSDTPVLLEAQTFQGIFKSATSYSHLRSFRWYRNYRCRRSEPAASLKVWRSFELCGIVPSLPSLRCCILSAQAVILESCNDDYTQINGTFKNCIDYGFRNDIYVQSNTNFIQFLQLDGKVALLHFTTSCSFLQILNHDTFTELVALFRVRRGAVVATVRIRSCLVRPLSASCSSMENRSW